MKLVIWLLHWRAVRWLVIVGFITTMSVGVALIAHYQAVEASRCAHDCHRASAWAKLPPSTIAIVGVAVGVGIWIVMVISDRLMLNERVYGAIWRSVRLVASYARRLSVRR